MDGTARPVRVARDWHAEAEQRLGRRLTPGERNVNIERINRLLKTAKLELAAAIDAEKARAIRQWLQDGNADTDVTPAMVRVLERLHLDGQAEALAEIRRHGLEPRRPVQAEPALAAVPATYDDASRAGLAVAARRFVAALKDRLGLLLRSQVSSRIVDKGVELDTGLAPLKVIAEEMERQVAGSLERRVAAGVVRVLRRARPRVRSERRPLPPLGVLGDHGRRHLRGVRRVGRRRVRSRGTRSRRCCPTAARTRTATATAAAAAAPSPNPPRIPT